MSWFFFFSLLSTLGKEGDIFFLFTPYHLTWGKGVVFHWGKLVLATPKAALCRVWWNWTIGSGSVAVWMLSIHFCFFAPLGLWTRWYTSLRFEQTWILFTQECFMSTLNEIDHVLQKKIIWYKHAECLKGLILFWTS